MAYLYHFEDSFANLDNWTVNQGFGPATAPELPSVVADGVMHAGASTLDCVRIPPHISGTETHRFNRLEREVPIVEGCHTLDITLFAKFEPMAAIGDYDAEPACPLIRFSRAAVGADSFIQSRIFLNGMVGGGDGLRVEQESSGTSYQSSQHYVGPGEWVEYTMRLSGIRTASCRQQTFVNGELVRWDQAGSGGAGYYSAGNNSWSNQALDNSENWPKVMIGETGTSGNPRRTVRIDGVSIRQYAVGEAPAIPWSTVIRSVTMTPGENPGEMHVRCWTPTDCAVVMSYGDGLTANLTPVTGFDGREHNALLTGLTDDTEYSYTLTATATGDATDTFSRTGTFHTDPGDTDIKVVVWGDVQDEGPARGLCSRVRESVSDIDMVISTGDVSNHFDVLYMTSPLGDADRIHSMQRAWEAHELGTDIVAVAAGNHDVTDTVNTLDSFKAMTPRQELDYYFDYGYARWIFIEAVPYPTGYPNSANITAAQLTFVQNALSSSAKRHNFVVMHQALYWNTDAEVNGSLGQLVGNQQELYNILAAYNAVLLCGHHHQAGVLKLGRVWQVNTPSPAANLNRGPTASDFGPAWAPSALGTWHTSILKNGWIEMTVTATHIDFAFKANTGAHITTVRVPSRVASARAART